MTADVNDSMLETPTETNELGLYYSRVIVGSFIITALGMAISIAIKNEIGIIADVSLTLATLIVALLVRPSDWQSTIWAPSVSWFTSLITVGQFAPQSAGSFKAQQAYLLVYGLGSHVYWIAGSTLGAIVIHMIRSRVKK